MKRSKKALAADDFSHTGGSIPGIFLDQLDDPVIVLGWNLDVRFINRACLVNLGNDAGDVLDTPFCRLIKSGEDAAVTRLLQACLTSGTRCDFACTLLNKTGSEGRYTVNAVCAAQDGGEKQLYLRLKRLDPQHAEFEAESFRAIVEGNPDPIFIQTDGRFAYLNTAACAFFGAESPEVLLGTPILDRVGPEFRNIAGERIRRLNEDRVPVTEIVEQRFIRFDGESAWAQTKGEPIVYGGRDSALIFARSTTLRKAAEEARRESEKKYATLFNEANIPILLVRFPELSIVEVNKAWTRALGFSRDEVLGKRSDDLGITPYNDSVRLLTEELEQSGAVSDVEMKIYTKSGEERMVLSNINVLSVDSEKYAMITNLDITERKKTERMLFEIGEKFQKFFDHSPMGMWIVGLDGKLIDVNKKVCEMFGYSQKELEQKYFADLSHPEDIAISLNVRDKILSGEKNSLSFEKRFVRKNGDVFWNFVVTTVLRNPDGTPAYFMTLLQDITEHKRADEKLFEVSEKFQKIFDYSAIGMVLTGLDGKLLNVNKKMCEMFGYPKAALEGKHFNEITYPEDIAVSNDMAQRMLSSAVASVAFEKRYVRGNGEMFWAFATTAVLRDKTGNPVHFITQLRDVTERKLAVEQLREVSERYQKTFDYSPIGMYIMDLNGNILNANRSACEIFGTTKEQLIGKNVADLTFAEDVPITYENLRRINAGKPSYFAFEKRFIRHNGEVFNSIVVVSVLMDADGKPEQCIAQIQDITERRRMVEELKAREAFSRAVMDNLPIGISVNSYEPPLVFEYMNDKFPKIYRTTREALKEVDTFFDAVYENPDFRETIRKRVLDDMNSGDPSRMRWENVPITRKGEETRYISAYNTLVPSRAMHISIVTDETERVRAAETIEKYTTHLEEMIGERTMQLEEAVKELEAFTYSVSHDLRAPLRTMNGFVRILLEDYGDQMDDEGRRVCQVIGNGAQNMGKLIDDLLSLSRIGRSSMVRMPMDMATMVKNLYQELTTESQRSRIDFSVGELPEAAADPTLIRQVWMNLLDNAVKFTSKKSRAKIDVTGSDTGDEIVYTVSDNGAGFDMRYQDKLFGVFQRLHSINEFEGTGVGLAIVQRIVRRHGGSIQAHGEENVGASFSFSIKKEIAANDTTNS